MIEPRACSLSIRAAVARALVAVVVLVGLVSPQIATVPARAAPSAVVAPAAVDDDLESQLRADLEAYLSERGRRSTSRPRG